MQPSSHMHPASSYRFGPFELNPIRYELLRGNRRVRLSVSLIDLLLLFVSRPGDLVTREQIVDTLWKEPQSVDVRQGINTAIARLRAALEDDPVNPRFLETVIGKGYRFIGEVDILPASDPLQLDECTGSSTNLQETLPERPPSPTVSDLPILHATGAPVSSAIPWRATIFSGKALLVAILTLAIICVTALIRRHTTQLSTPVRGLWEEHQITTNSADTPIEAASISPDGNVLAYAAANGLFLRELTTGQTRELKPPASRISQIVWLHDQTGLLLTGFDLGSDQPAIWTISLNGASTLVHRAANGGTPSPDGTSIAFITVDGREIHIADIHGGDERVLARTVAEEPFSALFWSADGKRVGYQLRHPLQVELGSVESHPSYQWTYASREVQTGRETSSTSDLFFRNAAETTRGRLVFLRSDGSRDPQQRGIWSVQIDPATGAPRGKPARICCDVNLARLSSLSVTADGAQVVAIRETGNFIISVGELERPGPTLNQVERLTSEDHDAYPHAWSTDSQMVYFESDRVSRLYHLFRQRIGQPNAEMLTGGENEQILPSILAGGKILVYEQREHTNEVTQRAIYRADVDGGNPKLVWKLTPTDEWRCPSFSGTSCVLRESKDREFVFSELDLANGRARELARTAWEPTLFGDWSLSPDGKTAALPSHREQSPFIRLVHLETGRAENIIFVRQPAQLRGIAWSIDQQGFYAAAIGPGDDRRLEFITLDGQVRPLRAVHDDSWIVPAPDGKKVAFVGATPGRNVVLWK